MLITELVSKIALTPLNYNILDTWDYSRHYTYYISSVLSTLRKIFLCKISDINDF